MADRLRVFLTVDVGPDDAVLGTGGQVAGGWERSEAGLAVLRETLRRVADGAATVVTATWFLRADALIRRQFDDPLAIFKAFAGFCEQRIAAGHEIGWMPHVYSAPDGAVDLDDLEATHAAVTAWGTAPRSVRMGNCFHDNRTMAALDRLGVRCDSSAVPGRSRHDAAWRMDWIGTPRAAYHPSVEDYRRPGTPQLEILELPLSVLPIRAPYDDAPLLRYVNPCMRRRYLWPGLRELIATEAYLVCALHPDEVVAGERGHPLIAYAPGELEANLRELVVQAEDLGREVTFETLERFAV